jgi:hypothetical protein
MNQAPYADPEDQSGGNFDFDDQSIRKGFIRKVFSILTVSNEPKFDNKRLREFSYQRFFP